MAFESATCGRRETITWRTLGHAAAASRATACMSIAMSAPRARLDGEQRFGVAVRQAGRDGLRAEARENRHGDRAQLGARQESDDGFGDHRQEQTDGIALADPEVRERIGQAASLGVELSV